MNNLTEHTDSHPPQNSQERSKPYFDTCCGGFLGDEGKGKFVCSIGKNYSMIIRCNGSSNATHRISSQFSDQVHESRQLPSFFYTHQFLKQGTDENKRPLLILCPGAFLNMDMLLKEIQKRKDKNLLKNYIKIASTIALILPPYKGEIKRRKKTGSLKQGLGKAVIARSGKNCLYLFQIKNLVRDYSEKKFRDVVEKMKSSCERFKFLESYDDEYFVTTTKRYMKLYEEFEKILGKDFCFDYSSFLYSLREKEESILLEGCNGILLDNVYGLLPEVTAYHTGPSSLATYSNLPHHWLRRDYVVLTSYSCCLHLSRFFPTEFKKEEEHIANQIYKNCNEFDMIISKNRRIGWMDLVCLRKSFLSCGNAFFHMNKLDALTGIEKIKICVRYLIEEKEYSIIPDDFSNHSSIKPIFVTLDGWKEDITKIHSYEEFPKSVKEFITNVEEGLSIKINSFGIGPNIEDIVLR